MSTWPNRGGLRRPLRGGGNKKNQNPKPKTQNPKPKQPNLGWRLRVGRGLAQPTVVLLSGPCSRVAAAGSRSLYLVRAYGRCRPTRQTAPAVAGFQP